MIVTPYKSNIAIVVYSFPIIVVESGRKKPCSNFGYCTALRYQFCCCISPFCTGYCGYTGFSGSA